MYTIPVRYTKDLLEEHAPNVVSFTGLARALDKAPVGGTITHIKRMCIKLGVDTSHFTGQAHNKGRVANNRLTPDEILIVTYDELARRPEHHRLKRALLEIGRSYKCAVCSTTDWNNKPLTLHVDHIDGNYRNNQRENLQFICPNCHSQTETFGRKKRNNGDVA